MLPAGGLKGYIVIGTRWKETVPMLRVGAVAVDPPAPSMSLVPLK